MADPTGGSATTMEEIEARAAAPAAPKLDEIKLDGEDIPAELRGKSVTEAVAFAKALAAGLKTSEAARMQAETNAQLAIGRTAEPPKVEEVKELSIEEIREKHGDDQLGALAEMQAQSERRLQRNLDQRMAPMFSSTAATVENDARSRYKEEFTLFGDQISAFVAKLPNAKQNLSTPQAWDDLVAYIRGQPGNVERIVEARIRGKSAPTLASAQAEQVETIGFSETSGKRSAIPKTVEQLDPTQLEIARGLDMTPADYIKWSQM